MNTSCVHVGSGLGMQPQFLPRRARECAPHLAVYQTRSSLTASLQLPHLILTNVYIRRCPSPGASCSDNFAQSTRLGRPASRRTRILGEQSKSCRRQNHRLARHSFTFLPSPLTSTVYFWVIKSPTIHHGGSPGAVCPPQWPKQCFCGRLCCR